MDDVRVYNRALGSNEIAALYLDGLAPAAIPANLTAVAGNNQVALNWSGVTGVTGYDILRATQSGGPYTSIGAIYATSYVDGTVTNGTAYYYAVAAMNALGDGPRTPEVSATPSLAVSLQTWLAANAITGLVNQAAVADWPDLSGNGDDAIQTNAIQRPAYVTNAINRLPVVRFNAGNSNVLTFSRPVQDDFTIFCVFRSTQGYGSGTLYFEGAGLVNGEVSGVTDDFGTCLFANGSVSAGTGDPDVAADSPGGYNDGNPHLMTFRRTESTGETDLFMDSVFVGATNGSTTPLTAPAQLVLGAQQTMLNFFSGDIAEVKIFSSALPDNQRLTEEAELECKYGITSTNETATAPAVPAGLTGQPGSRAVLVSWPVSSGAVAYDVSSAANTGGPFTPLAVNLAANSYLDTNAVSGSTNYYEVTALNNCATSPASTPLAVYLPKPVLILTNAGGAAFTITWPAWAGDWTLSYATNLNPPVVWYPVTNAVVTNSSQLNVTMPAGVSGTRFFRLAAPN